MAESSRKGRAGEVAPGVSAGRSRHERAGDFIALLGLAFLAPPALTAFGVTAPAVFARNAFGAFGESGILLLAFAACFLLAALFGTVRKAIPVLSGLAAGVLLFAGAFELPGLEGVRRSLFRFAPFAEAGPALFSGALVASCVVAVGGRARIVHGIKGASGHAWAEVWVGSGAKADAVLERVARAAGRRATSLAATLDRTTGERWLVLDWELGSFSFDGDRLEVAWESGR